MSNIKSIYLALFLVSGISAITAVTGSSWFWELYLIFLNTICVSLLLNWINKYPLPPKTNNILLPPVNILPSIYLSYLSFIFHPSHAFASLFSETVQANASPHGPSASLFLFIPRAFLLLKGCCLLCHPRLRILSVSSIPAHCKAVPDSSNGRVFLLKENVHVSGGPSISCVKELSVLMVGTGRGRNVIALIMVVSRSWWQLSLWNSGRTADSILEGSEYSAKWSLIGIFMYQAALGIQASLPQTQDSAELFTWLYKEQHGFCFVLKQILASSLILHLLRQGHRFSLNRKGARHWRVLSALLQFPEALYLWTCIII